MVTVRRIGKALSAVAEEGRAIHTGGTKLAFACRKGLARSLHARYTSLHRLANAIAHDGLLGDGDTDADEPG
jgi:hypothetical protein